MSLPAEQSQEVPVDVLPPVPRDAVYTIPQPQSPATGHAVPFVNLRTFYHPASGVVILGLDWLAFGTDLMTGFLALPVICVLSFIVSFFLLYMIQTKWTQDKTSTALGKAFLGAFLVGLPFPITGTMLGAAVLALAGLPHHPVEMIKRLTFPGSTRTK